MALQQLKSRWDGKCAKCGRDIKAGWTIYFEKVDGRSVIYCPPCGRQMLESGQTTENQALTIIAFDMNCPVDVCSNCGNHIGEEEPYYYDTVNKVVLCDICGKLMLTAKTPEAKAIAEVQLTLYEVVSTSKAIFEIATSISNLQLDIQKQLTMALAKKQLDKSEKEISK